MRTKRGRETGYCKCRNAPRGLFHFSAIMTLATKSNIHIHTHLNVTGTNGVTANPNFILLITKEQNELELVFVEDVFEKTEVVETSGSLNIGGVGARWMMTTCTLWKNKAS